MSPIKIAALTIAFAACVAGGMYFFRDIFTERPEPKSAGGIGGYWRIADSDTGKTESVIICYAADEVYYCRMVAVYDDDGKLTDTTENCAQRSKGIRGNPKLCEFDFIWGLKFNGKIYDSGSVIDPDSGSVYNCKAWYDSEKDCLVVRGELFGFGQNQYWGRFDAKSLPQGANVDSAGLKPNIPKH